MGDTVKQLLILILTPTFMGLGTLLWAWLRKKKNQRKIIDNIPWGVLTLIATGMTVAALALWLTPVGEKLKDTLFPEPEKPSVKITSPDTWATVQNSFSVHGIVLAEREIPKLWLIYKPHKPAPNHQGAVFPQETVAPTDIGNGQYVWVGNVSITDPTVGCELTVSVIAADEQLDKKFKDHAADVAARRMSAGYYNSGVIFVAKDSINVKTC